MPSFLHRHFRRRFATLTPTGKGRCGDDDASANSGTTGPRIVRGTVEIDGTIRAGQGFSTGHQGPAGFRIDFDVPFSDAPVVVVSTEKPSSDPYTCNVWGGLQSNSTSEDRRSTPRPDSPMRRSTSWLSLHNSRKQRFLPRVEWVRRTSGATARHDREI